MGAALFIIVCVAFLAAPVGVLIALPVLFIFQDALVSLAGGRETALGAVLQNGDEIVLAAILLSTLGLAVARDRRPRLRPWLLWYGVFIAAACVSIVMHGSGWGPGILGLFLVSKGFIFAFVLEQVDWTEDEAQRWLRVLLWGIVAVLLFAIPDALFPEQFREVFGFRHPVEYRAGIPSIVSVLGHAGGYGWIMGVGALLAIAMLLSGRSPRWGLLFMLFLVASFLSMRRKPILALIVSVIIVAAGLSGRLNRRQVVGAAALLIVLAVPILIVAMPVLIEGFIGYLGAEAFETQARTVLYAGAVELARDNFPFGVGVGRYGSYGSVVDYSPVYYQMGMNRVYGMSPDYSEFIQDTFWPQILGETGVIGLIGYGGALLSITAAAWGAARRSTSTKLQPLLLLGILISFETLFESSAAPAYSVPMQAGLSIGLPALATTAAVAHEHRERTRRAAELARPEANESRQPASTG